MAAVSGGDMYWWRNGRIVLVTPVACPLGVAPPTILPRGPAGVADSPGPTTPRPPPPPPPGRSPRDQRRLRRPRRSFSSLRSPAYLAMDRGTLVARGGGRQGEMAKPGGKGAPERSEGGIKLGSDCADYGESTT